jgi:hypothetical protein
VRQEAEGAASCRNWSLEPAGSANEAAFQIAIELSGVNGD